MPKSTPVTDKTLIRRIRALASEPHRIAVTRRALADMAARSLTKAGVCEAICDYIDGSSPVDRSVTDTAAGHIGELVYQFYPTIEAEDLLVKVRIDESRSPPTLVLISVHELHRSEP